MPWYLTVYNADGSEPDVNNVVGSYSGDVWARSARHARQVAKRRGLGEKILGETGRRKAPYTTPSEWLAKRRLRNADVLHALCWMAHLALKSGAATPEELVGDRGLIHEYAHMRSYGGRSGVRRRELIAKAREIEERIPGFTRRADHR